MKIYRIKQSSRLLFIIILIILGVGGVFIYNSLTESLPEVIMFISIAIILFISYFTARYLSTAEIEIIMDKDGIKYRCVKQNLFRIRRQMTIAWVEVYEYLVEYDRDWTTFELITKEGLILKINHNDDFDSEDDFRRFVRNFEHKVKKINSAEVFENNIKEAPTIYDGRTGLTIAIVGGATIMLLFIAILVQGRAPNYLLLSGSLGVAFFISQVYKHRKKS